MGKFFNIESDEKPENNEGRTENTSAKDFSGELDAHKTVSTGFFESYFEHIEQALQHKEYHHWNSVAEQERNRKRIENYDEKKRAVDKVSLQTQSSILKKYRDRFDEENVSRMRGELGSNKTEIYNEPYFVRELSPDIGQYKVLGSRDFPDGKICIRDSDDVTCLKHTATHETMHDLSYQHVENRIRNSINDSDGSPITISETRIVSGLQSTEKRVLIENGESSDMGMRRSNRFLNEGITELYTIEEMQARGEFPHFNSYTQEVGWALNLRDKVGDDLIADAYFGGNVESLENKINSMSSIENAWKELNRNIDAYHCTDNQEYKRVYKNAVDSIIDGLQDGKSLVLRREYTR